MANSRRPLVLIGALGGLGGAINAWLCYANLPVPMGGGKSNEFSWHIIPAGALHGLLLAVLTMAAWRTIRDCSWRLKIIRGAFAGWFAGWISFIPLQWYISFKDFDMGFLGPDRNGLVAAEIIEGLLWPWQRSAWLESLWMPLAYFGLVAAIIVFGFCFLLRPGQSRLLLPPAVCVVAASLGSLWWWILFEMWWFSLLHGAIWGSLVGFGVWKSQLLDAPH